MINIEKFKDFDSSVNEMAFKNPANGKAWQKGDILKVSVLDRDFSDGSRTLSWSDFLPDSKGDFENGKILFEVTANSTKFINGKVIYLNCALGKYDSFRMAGRNIEVPGLEWKYLEPKRKDIESMIKMHFTHGDEGTFMDAKGDEVKVTEGYYKFNGLAINFALTIKAKEPVLGLISEKAEKSSYSSEKKIAFYVKLSDLQKSKSTLSNEELETIAGWFVKHSGMDVKFVSEKSWRGVENKFVLQTYRIRCNKSDGFIKDGSIVNYFGTKVQAEKTLAALKEQKFSIYDRESLEIVKEDQLSITLEELINLMKVNGVTVTIKDLLKGSEDETLLRGF